MTTWDDGTDTFYMPHHGSFISWNEEFYQKYYKTNFWFCSAGIRNKYGHPHLPLIIKLQNAKKNIGWSNEHNRIKLRGIIYWQLQPERPFKSYIENLNSFDTYFSHEHYLF